MSGTGMSGTGDGDVGRRRAPSLHTIYVVARREFLWRASGRTFRVATGFLVLVGALLALAPTFITALNGSEKPQAIALVEGDAAPGAGYASGLTALLNASTPSIGLGGQGGSSAGYKVIPVADLATARAGVLAGTYGGALALSRTTGDDLAATFYSNLTDLDRTFQLVRQAAAAMTIQDRLTRAGVPPGSQASVFAPTSFQAVNADPAKPERPSRVTTLLQGGVVGFVLTIFIFMAIIVYCQWIAMSVAEEKSSRVMELILGAARPFELLAGKVIGVGGLGVLQLLVVAASAAIALLLQDRIAARLLGGQPSIEIPPGLTPELIVSFAVFFVLGFTLYATLFAGVASLVSRQEDVNTLITPLTMVAAAGYMIAAYASTGVIPLGGPLVVILSFIPFLSPYLMLTRIAGGAVQPIEPVAAAVLLALTILGALWVAGRLYGAGVLIYGQKATFGNLVRAFRRA